MIITQEYGTMSLEDILRLFLGKRIGQGSYRDVFEFAIDPALVVKIEARNHKEGYCTFSNVTEMGLWQESKDHPWRKWLAPCCFLSGNGIALLQRKTEPCPLNKLPKIVPNFLADLKPDNWGLYQGKPVVHDYGNHGIFSIARKAHRMVKGRWHDGLGNDIKLP